MDTLRFSADREARLLGFNMSPNQSGGNAPKAKTNFGPLDSSQSPQGKGKGPEGLDNLRVRKDDERRSQFNGKYDRVYDEMDKRLGGYKQEIKSLTNKLANPKDKYGNDEEHTQYEQKINVWIDNMKNIYERMSTGSYANLQKIENCYSQIEDRIAQLEAKLAARGQAVKPTYAERVRDGRTEQFKNSSEFKSVDIHGLSADHGSMEMKPSYFLLRTPANVSLHFGDGMPDNGFKSNYGMSNGIKYIQVTEEGARYLNGKTITVMVYDKETNAADAERRGVKGTEMKAMITRDAGENGNLVFTLEKTAAGKPAPESATAEPAPEEAKVASPLKPTATPSKPEKDTKQAEKERMAKLVIETDKIVKSAKQEIKSGNGFSMRNGVKRGIAAVTKEMAEYSAKDQSGVDGTDSKNMRYIALEKILSEFRDVQNKLDAEDKDQEGKDKKRAELLRKTDAAVATADKTLSLKTNGFDTRRDLGAAMKAITDEMEELSKQGLASKEKVKVGRYEEIRNKYNAYENVLRDMRAKDLDAEKNREKLRGLQEKSDQAIGSAEVSIADGADGEKRAALEAAMNAITAELTEYSAQKITSTPRAQIPRIEDMKKAYNRFDAMAKEMDAAAKKTEKPKENLVENLRGGIDQVKFHLEAGHGNDGNEVGSALKLANKQFQKISREMDREDAVDALKLRDGVDAHDGNNNRDYKIRYDVTTDTLVVEDVTKTPEKKSSPKKTDTKPETNEKPRDLQAEAYQGYMDAVAALREGKSVFDAQRIIDNQTNTALDLMTPAEQTKALDAIVGTVGKEFVEPKFHVKFVKEAGTVKIEDLSPKKAPEKSRESPLDNLKNAIDQVKGHLEMGHGKGSEVEGALKLANTLYKKIAYTATYEDAVHSLGLDDGIAVHDGNNNLDYKIRLDARTETIVVEDVVKPVEKKPAPKKTPDTKPESVERTSETVLGEIGTALDALGTSIMDQGPDHPETVAILEELKAKSTEAAELFKADATQLQVKMEALVTARPALAKILSGDNRTYAVTCKNLEFAIKDVTPKPKGTPPAAPDKPKPSEPVKPAEKPVTPAKPAEKPATPAKPKTGPESRETTDVTKLRETTEKARAKIDDVTRDAIVLDGKFDKSDAENIVKAIDAYVTAAQAEFNALTSINDAESEARKTQLTDGIAKQTKLKEQLTANHIKPAEATPPAAPDRPTTRPKEVTVSPDVQALIDELKTILKKLENRTPEAAPAKPSDAKPTPEKPAERADRSKELGADIAKLKLERAQVDADWKTEVAEGFDALHADGDKGFKKLDDLETRAKALDAQIALKEAELKSLESKEAVTDDVDALIKKRAELTAKVPTLKLGETAERKKLQADIAEIDGKLKTTRGELDTKLKGLTGADKADERKTIENTIKKIDDTLKTTTEAGPAKPAESPDASAKAKIEAEFKGKIDGVGVDVKGDKITLTFNEAKTRDNLLSLLDSKTLKGKIPGVQKVEKESDKGIVVTADKSLIENPVIQMSVLITAIKLAMNAKFEDIKKSLDK